MPDTDPVPPSEPEPSPGPGALPLPAAGTLHGTPECRAALVQGLLALAPGRGPLAGQRRLWLADPDFDGWPLDDANVLQALSAWARQPGRHIDMAADDFQAIARRQPRFQRWRRDFGHALSAWRSDDGPLPPDLCGLYTRPLWLQRQPTRLWQLQVSHDRQQADRVEHQVAAFLQRCEPAWPVTTLGL